MSELKFIDVWNILTENLTEDEKQWVSDNMSIEEIIDLFVKITK
tara:strand:- start:14838 stop:14969 length:132 start_codon:yes stop_codon:yes gene_type:complete